MRFKFFILLSLFAASSAQAFDTTTEAVVAVVYATTQVTTAPFERKIVLAAHDDAATFIASDGVVRGAQLESALLFLRQNSPQLKGSDLELAQAILVQ